MTTTEKVLSNREDDTTVWVLQSGFPHKLIKVSEDSSGVLEANYIDSKDNIERVAFAALELIRRRDR